MKFAYLVLSYKNFAQLRQLVADTAGKDVRIFIHVDKKVPLDNHICQQIKEIDPTAQFIEQRTAVFWGGFNLMRATIALIREYLDSGFVADYIHICTDSDGLLCSRQQAEEYLQHNDMSCNYITCEPLPKARWKYGGWNRLEQIWLYDYCGKFVTMAYVKLQKIVGFKRRLPQGVEFFGGSGWMTITHPAVQYIAEQSRPDNELYQFFSYVAVPDELYFQTLLMNSPLRQSVTRDNNLRFIKWHEGDPHPYTLTEEHRAEWEASGKLIGRKFLPEPLPSKSAHEYWGEVSGLASNIVAAIIRIFNARHKA